MITYFELPMLKRGGTCLGVKLEGRVVGRIMPVQGGYRYQPVGTYLNSSKWGDLFATADDCKRSVEGN